MATGIIIISYDNDLEMIKPICKADKPLRCSIEEKCMWSLYVTSTHHRSAPGSRSNVILKKIVVSLCIIPQTISSHEQESCSGHWVEGHWA